MRLIQIQYQGIPENWSQLGGTSDSIVTPTTHIGGIDGIYWYRKLYHPDTARYEEVPPNVAMPEGGTINATRGGFNCPRKIYLNTHSALPHM